MTKSYVEESIYQAASWSTPRRIIIQPTRPESELFFLHAFFVTNLSESFPPEAIIASYKKAWHDGEFHLGSEGWFLL